MRRRGLLICSSFLEESYDRPHPGEDHRPVDDSPWPSDTPRQAQFATQPPLYQDRYEHDACGIGFVAQKDGRRSNDVLRLAVTALVNHAHRGAVAADGKSGDGAGVLTQIPHELLARHLAQMGFTAPAPGDLALGMIFLPRYNVGAARTRAQNPGRNHRRVRPAEDHLARRAGQRRCAGRLGAVAAALHRADRAWRDPAEVAAGDEFERKLYLVRKRATQRIWAESITNFYMPSLSSKTIVYKGLFMAPQLPMFYTDLNDPDYRTAIAVFHQRYSTNTFPTWERAQPFRMLCHNGEINTLQGNLDLDAGARGRPGPLRHLGRGRGGAGAGDLAARQRLGQARQRPRSAGAVGPRHPPRHDDAGAEGLGEARRRDARTARVLPLP